MLIFMRMESDRLHYLLPSTLFVTKYVICYQLRYFLYYLLPGNRISLQAAQEGYLLWCKAVQDPRTSVRMCIVSVRMYTHTYVRRTYV